MNGEQEFGVEQDRLWCDVLSFEAALAGGEKEDALDLYEGNFLEGFFLPGCLEFERWADAERSRLRDLAAGAVLSLSREMESAGNPVGAVGWLRRAREWAAYDELILRRQLELLLALGDRSGAVREYESFARRLSVDLGLEPSDEVKDLLHKPAETIRSWAGAGRQDDDTPSLLPQTPGRSSNGGRRSALLRIAAIGFFGVAIGAGAALSGPRLWSALHSQDGPVPAEQDARSNVVVLPLENATGDLTLDLLGETAAEQLVLELASTGLVGVGPVAALGDHPVESGGQALSGGRASGPPPALNDADYLVTGSFSDLNGRLAYQARIFEVRSGKIVAVIERVEGSLADPGEATEELRKRLAGALAMVLDPRLSDLAFAATEPPSFEAYQLLADALDSAEGGEVGVRGVAREAFLRAIAFDPEFTLPLFLAFEKDNAIPEVRALLTTFQPRRDELPRWERAMFDVFLSEGVGNQLAVYEAWSRVVEIAPNSERIFRLAQAAVRANRPREALGLFTQLESNREWLEKKRSYWTWLWEARFSLGDWEAILKDIERARALGGETPQGPVMELHALARLGRVEEATDRAVEILQSTNHGRVPSSIPYVFASVGLEEEAQRLAEVSLASLSRREEVYPDQLAKILVCAQRYEEARQELSRRWDSVYWEADAYTVLAYMAAREGRTEEATRLSGLAVTTSGIARDGSRKGSPNGYGLMSEVQVAAHLGDLAGAVRFLREAFQLGLPRGSFLFTRWNLTPLYGYRPFEDLMRPEG